MGGRGVGQIVCANRRRLLPVAAASMTKGSRRGEREKRAPDGGGRGGVKGRVRGRG